MSSSYFPALDQYLAGETPLISWRTAYRALCDEAAALDNSSLHAFFTDDHTVALLANALSPYAPPSARTAGEFDTKTAPIHAAQPKNGAYKLDEIKEDAKWLSRELHVEELAALRIAMIECQERPADQLMNAACNGTSVLEEVIAMPASTASNGPARPALTFADQQVRRHRLLLVYLSESNHMLRLSADLMSRCAVSKSIVREQPAAASWIDQIAAKVTDTMCPKNGRNEAEAFIAKCISKLDSVLERGDASTSWPKVFADDTKAPGYVDSLRYELTHTLRLLLAALYQYDGIPSASALLSWFALMEKHFFLQGNKHLLPLDRDVPRLLLSIVSVEMMKLQLAIGEIMQAADVDTPTLTGSHYLNDEESLRSLNLILHRVSLRGNNIAAPAILAWSIITSVIRDIALSHRDQREFRNEHGPDDTVEGLARRASRRGSRNEPLSRFEKLYFKLQSSELDGDVRDDLPRNFLLRSVDHLRVFRLIATLATVITTTYSSDAEASTALFCKEALFDLTRESLSFVQYDEEVFEAVLSLLTPAEHCPVSKQQTTVLAKKLLADYALLRPAFLDQALARFPYELSPLVRLGTLLANAQGDAQEPEGIAGILHRLRTFTLQVPAEFRSYELIDEVDDNNAMRLLEALPIITRRDAAAGVQQLLLMQDSTDAETPEQYVPAETTGNIIREKRPMVFMLNHDSSGLEYLSALLFTFTKGSQVSCAAEQATLDLYGAAEIIALFTSLLAACLDQSDGATTARELMAKFDAGLGNSHDIISIIADLFESELLAHIEQVAEDGSLPVVAAAAEFLNIIIRISPERVWSIVAKSSLLGLATGAISLVAVVNGSEVQLGQYRFLQACVEMQSLLLQDALAGLAKRNARTSEVVKTTRFSLKTKQDSLDATPARTMSVVLNAYQKVLLDAYQSFSDWKWEDLSQRCRLTVTLLKSFSDMLRSTYGLNVAKAVSRRLTFVIAPAANSIVDTCASKTGSNPMASTLRRILQETLPIADDATPVQIRQLLIEQARAVFGFLVILLRVAKHGNDLLGQTEAPAEWHKVVKHRSYRLASSILQNMPALASLLATEHAIKADLFTLFEELVSAVGAGDEDPPSILAQFDTDAAQAFLQVVTQLDRPLCELQVERNAWDFLAVVMDSRQQWFAIYLLTGRLPKSRAHRCHEEEIKGKPILAHVLSQLASIEDLQPQRAIGMLRFVAIAQQTWAWATNEVRSHTDFLTNTMSWLGSLRGPPRNPTPDASITSAREHEMAAHLCDIFAVNLHAGLEIGDRTVLKLLVTKLDFLRDRGARVDEWNKSLHRSLETNLARSFPAIDLSDFMRTSVNPAPYGRSYVYDTDIATIIFQHNRAWDGATADQGFADEFGRANANLSLLHAQATLLKSWKTLATTLCDCAEQDPSLPLELAKVVEQCLVASVEPQLDQPGMADAMHMRLELAFVLTSKLVALKTEDDAMKRLLPAAWTLVATFPADYDIATLPEELRYYRQLLQVLYLTILPHSYVAKTRADGEMHSLSPQTASILVNIVGKVIAPGFKALCSNLHGNVELALPADFALLTALLQAILAVPGINSIQTLLSDVVVGSNIIRGALSLYSWADRLSSEDTQDPIYGEIAIMFLLSLSTVRPIAEQMALEGVLAQLSSANLSSYFRTHGGKGPFDEPQRMFVIWTEGYLPLCLNLLDSVGPAIAAEIAAFLNGFPSQLDRAAHSLINETPTARNPRAGTITLGTVSEAHSLAMISLVLSSDTARGAADGINAADIPDFHYDGQSVKSLVESLMRSKRSLIDRIRPANPLEERWMTTPGVANADNILVQKIEKELSSMLTCFKGVEGVP